MDSFSEFGRLHKPFSIFPYITASNVNILCILFSQPLDLELKPLSNKVSSVHLGVQVRCEFVKCGKPRYSYTISINLLIF